MRTPAFVATAAGILAGITAFAQGPVYSVNIVGFQKISVGEGLLDMASTPFVKASGTLQNVVGNQGTAGETVDDADNILLWDNVLNGYKIFFLYNNPNNVNDTLNGKWVDENYAESTDSIVPGRGFWISNKAGTGTNTTTVVGDVVMDATKSITILQGLNQISYPYSTSKGLNDFALKIANGVAAGETIDEGDKVYLWDEELNGYVNYFLYNNPNNVNDALNNKWVDENYSPASGVIQAGQAFFFERLGASSINWTEAKPY